MKNEFSWILLGIASVFVIFIVGPLLNVNVIAIFAMIGLNPVSFIAGIVIGIGTGYFLATGCHGQRFGD
jgi:hypothetical protein